MKYRESPCGRCGWKYATFHICVDLSVPCPGEFQTKPPKPKGKQTRSYPNGLSEEHQSALNAGRAQRWVKHREKHAERDAKLVKEYSEGVGVRPLALKYKISYQTARGIIHRAAEAGLITVRPPHRTIRRPGKMATT